MSSSSPEPQSRQLRPIRRQQVQQCLVIAAFAAAQLLAGCTEVEPEPEPPKMVPALFYKDQAQCEADTRQQQTQYQAALQATTSQGTDLPKRPTLAVEDCAAQMKAAMAEHDRHAPVYQSQSDCEADGVRCEYYDGGGGSGYSSHSTTYVHSGYRPRFGGTYLYPDGPPDSTDTGYIYSNGRTVHQPRTVYESSTVGNVVTPQGDVVTQSASGRVQSPDYAGFAAPSRPTGTAAKGTISGRSTSGFGSTYKGTGRGGK
jgi:uncharacterized protein YgiB involved in biofilm formation